MTKKAPTGRELLQATALVSFLIGVVAFFAMLRGNAVIRQRQEEGIYIDATVVEKDQAYESSGRSGSYVNVLDVMFFERASYKEKPVEIVEGVEITLKQLVDLGDFHSTEIRRVSDDLFDQIEEGESVRIVYLASEPERAWLAEEVADIEVWNGRFFVIGCFAVGIILLLGARWLPRPS